MLEDKSYKEQFSPYNDQIKLELIKLIINEFSVDLSAPGNIIFGFMGCTKLLMTKGPDDQKEIAKRILCWMMSKKENVSDLCSQSIITDEDGKKWLKNAVLHREDGPAVECHNGDKFWFKNGQLHREDGPAIEYATGTKYWYQNGQLHREDGPAIDMAVGTKVYYIKGVKQKREE